MVAVPSSFMCVKIKKSELSSAYYGETRYQGRRDRERPACDVAHVAISVVSLYTNKTTWVYYVCA